MEWNNEGITIEGHQQHAEIIVQQLGIQNERILSSPGERINPKDMSEEDHEEPGAADAEVYRAASARANYMALDRSDIRLAVKELTRHMSKPRNKYYKQLVHLGKYLLGKPRIVTKYEYQKN